MFNTCAQCRRQSKQSEGALAENGGGPKIDQAFAYKN